MHLKTFVSFTDNPNDAQHYSNGIIIEMAPEPNSALWKQVTYVTDLSDEADKTEYIFVPGSGWVITGARTETIDGKVYTVISAQEHLE